MEIFHFVSEFIDISIHIKLATLSGSTKLTNFAFMSFPNIPNVSQKYFLYLLGIGIFCLLLQVNWKFDIVPNIPVGVGLMSASGNKRPE